MSYDYYGIIIILFSIFTSTNSCWNTIYNNITYGHIENLNFYLGQSQIKNISCSWIINNEKQFNQSYYIISLRLIKLEYEQTLWSNELILKTDNKQIIFDNINQRTFYIPSSSATLEIYFQSKLQSNYLNIQRFLLEFIYINNNNNNNIHNNNDYFHCVKSGLIIPKQWKCNCLYECSDDDYSDEDNCPLCPMIKTSNSLLCHSNETWCLPVTNTTDKIDPNGVCIPYEQNSQCSYSLNCETIISYYKDHGEIILDNSTLSNRQSLCFIIIAKEKYKIKLIINQYNFLYQHPDLEFLIYDGSEQQNHLLLSSIMLLQKTIIQTRENHIATIIIRKNRSQENLNRFFLYQQIQQDNFNNILLNITWLTSLCPYNQLLCNGHNEIKCYSSKQRCDGIWDCISGDDELGCLPSSCPTTFACNDPLHMPSDQPRCYTWSERCNGNSFCVNRIDEKNCTHWWCNSNNGTFLCKNFNCIYETWICDGTNDCGDNSDEINCPFRISRRIMTAAVIGGTICLTLFIIALGCTCKLLHLRLIERQTSLNLLNPQQYIQHRREQFQQQSTNNNNDNNNNNNLSSSSSTITDNTRRLAPPSYNQTMGYSNDDEERHALLTEYLRLAGLDNFIPLSFSRSSRHRNRRHRRHHRRHHRYHDHQSQNEDSRIALLESNTTHSNLSTNRFDHFRSRLRSLLARNHSINTNNNSTSSNDFDIYERYNSLQPIALSNRSYIESQELPPTYIDEQLLSIHHENDIQSSITIPTTTTTTPTPSTSFHICKRQIPLNTLCDHLEEQTSSIPITTIQDDEQASSDDDDDDDDDDKLLMP
ncbi:unnamed protein product [Rotaria sordida]|uniref:Uncharacterized protein n=1 Tax=Rotaria sordida TaxID=392033 RepID=A0A814EAG9_9BILA|nr:unnamed protein product [Rotaria sordida]CAF3740532.1 unnamed protein product [Rotaria sordida]